MRKFDITDRLMMAKAPGDRITFNVEFEGDIASAEFTVEPPGELSAKLIRIEGAVVHFQVSGGVDGNLYSFRVAARGSNSDKYTNSTTFRVCHL